LTIQIFWLEYIFSVLAIFISELTDEEEKIMKTAMKILVVMAMVAALGACGPKAGVIPLKNGVEVIHTERTDFFGTDHSGSVVVDNSWKKEPTKVELRKTYEKTTESHEKLGGGTCSKQQAPRNIKYEKVTEKVTEEVLNPAAKPRESVVIGGANPSVGNILLPAIVEGAGIATSGALLPGGGDSVWAPTVVSESGAIAGAEANADADARAQGTRAKGSSHQHGESCAGGGCRR
jgi:hypothetical protein